MGPAVERFGGESGDLTVPLFCGGTSVDGGEDTMLSDLAVMAGSLAATGRAISATGATDSDTTEDFGVEFSEMVEVLVEDAMVVGASGLEDLLADLLATKVKRK